MSFFKRRRQAKEMKREIQFRQGRARVQSYIQKAQQSKQKYWELGKKCLQLGDRQQFAQIAKTYQWTLDQINRWERYLVQMETIAARKDQVKATGEFLKSVQAMSKSMLAGVRPDQIADMQLDLEQAITKADMLDEALNVVMETSSDAIFSSDELSDESFQEIEKAMRSEAVQDEGDAFDAKIEEGLKKVEEQMRKEMK